jgi:hypothetical protein
MLFTGSVLLLGGCASYNKGLDVVQGTLAAASTTVDIFRAAGEDTRALWVNIWTPVGLAGTPIAEPFAVPQEE